MNIDSYVLYIVAWTGGLEAPQFTPTNSLEYAQEFYAECAEDAAEGDWLSILMVNTANGTVTEIDPETGRAA